MTRALQFLFFVLVRIVVLFVLGLNVRRRERRLLLVLGQLDRLRAQALLQVDDDAVDRLHRGAAHPNLLALGEELVQNLAQVEVVRRILALLLLGDGPLGRCGRNRRHGEAVAFRRRLAYTYGRGSGSRG